MGWGCGVSALTRYDAVESRAIAAAPNEQKTWIQGEPYPCLGCCQ